MAQLSPKLILFHPDWNHDVEVHTDASKIDCGAVQAQRAHGALRPVRFAPRSFNSSVLRGPTSYQEVFIYYYHFFFRLLLWLL